MTEQRYVSALAYRSLTALYDPVVRFTSRESRFKTALLQQAELSAGQRVLDLACGTATLTLLAKQLQPQAEFVGVDGDPQMLDRARRKAVVAGVTMQFDESLSHQLPYADASFDRVLSSLFFHHLNRANKLSTLREVRRVLKPDGELHVADWGKAANGLMHTVFYGVQLLDGFANTADNVTGQLPKLMLEAGFIQARETKRFATALGTLSLYRARPTGVFDSGAGSTV